MASERSLRSFVRLRALEIRLRTVSGLKHLSGNRPRRHCLELAPQKTHLRQEPPLHSNAVQVADAKSRRVDPLSGSRASESHPVRHRPKRIQAGIEG
jgi:hypothetical protein